jgi:hypothetical protein
MPHNAIANANDHHAKRSARDTRPRITDNAEAPNNTEQSANCRHRRETSGPNGRKTRTNPYSSTIPAIATTSRRRQPEGPIDPARAKPDRTRTWRTSRRRLTNINILPMSPPAGADSISKLP